MSKAKTGDTVKVHYTGRLLDGTVLDSSREGEPLKIVLGRGDLIGGFEQAIVGMQVGEEKTTALKSTEAFGLRDPGRIVHLQRNQLPLEAPWRVGQSVRIRHDGGIATEAVVVEATEFEIVLDTNHPLAGRDLLFTVQLLDIVSEI